jgi:hypothetical protein
LLSDILFLTFISLASAFLAHEDANERPDPWVHSLQRYRIFMNLWCECAQGSSLLFASSSARNEDAKPDWRGIRSLIRLKKNFFYFFLIFFLKSKSPPVPKVVTDRTPIPVVTTVVNVYPYIPVILMYTSCIPVPHTGTHVLRENWKNKYPFFVTCASYFQYDTV